MSADGFTATATGPVLKVHDRLRQAIWQAPLVPVALAGTVGVMIDRWRAPPFELSLVLAGAAVFCWLGTSGSNRPMLPLCFLLVAVGSLGAAAHHRQRAVYGANDLAQFATEDQRPARVRGYLDEEPTTTPAPPDDPLRSFPRGEQTASVLTATSLQRGDEWLAVSGRTRLLVTGRTEGFHVGDAVEVVGRLSLPSAPANPGEFDYGDLLLDQHVRSVLSVREPAGVKLRAAGGSWSLTGLLTTLRGLGQRQLTIAVPDQEGAVATALLLGDGSAMTGSAWDKYLRTGVIHVLAISGQHLVVLAAFLWLILRISGLRQARGAWFVALFLLGYALVAGGRPPVLRAAVAVCVVCGGLILRRPVVPANTFALAWLVVGVLNPADLFGTGCQLSFLSVAVLMWGTGWLNQRSDDPLDRLIERFRPAWQRLLFAGTRAVGQSFLLSLIIWLAVAPLVAARYHLVSPIAVVLGPPLTLLTSIALLAGFLLLALAPLGGVVTVPFAWVTTWSLAGCGALVDLGDRVPGGHCYVPDLPDWWLVGYHLGLAAVLTISAVRRRWNWVVPLGLAWLCLGLLNGVTGAGRSATELRVTFLAVGHGGCTVLETPDGRTLLYDAGSLAGPDVTRRQIAPYLWHRGIGRIDEVILSHADLDHFNGLPALLERFAVGRITCTPSFQSKLAPGVRATTAAWRAAGIEVRIVHAGDRLVAGDVEMLVLHPPPVGPEGNENCRSLVLLVRHEGHTLLLTGDLEGLGLERVLRLPEFPVDVLMAPHHGSRFTNTPALAQWARPKLVVSCEGPPRWPKSPLDPYEAVGATVLGTWPHGAITVRSSAEDLTADTFVTKLGFRLRPGLPSRPVGAHNK